MFKWLKKCVEESQKFDAATSEATQNTCKYESDTSDCSLIQQLKEKQSIEKTIKNDIKTYEDCCYDAKYTYQFLKMMNNYSHNKLSYTLESCTNFYILSLIERVVSNMSMEDIENLINELKAIRQRDDILAEKRSALKAIQTDVNDIKSKLGIE